MRFASVRFSFSYYILFISISILIIRCNSSSNNQNEKQIISNKDIDINIINIDTDKRDTTPSDKKKKETQKQINSRLSQFIKRVDTLTKHSFTPYIRHWTKPNGRLFSQLKPSSNCNIQLYIFDPENADVNYLYKFRLYIATYNDSNEMNETFELIRRGAKSLDIPSTPIGLTYTNDYVIKTTNQIYWLNTGCPYKYNLHKAISQILVEAYKINIIKDAIYCKCGGECFDHQFKFE